LYAGVAYKTPFYVHALIANSYLESSYRFINGGSQISKNLSREIHSRRGKIIKHVKVAKLVEQDGQVIYAESENGQRYYGKNFISNIHPAQTLDMLDSTLIKKAYRNRIKSLENSISTFYVNA